MSNIVFPEGITWNQRYVTGGDLVPVGIELTGVGNLYRYTNNSVIRVVADTSNVTNMSSMFNNDTNLTSVTQFDTSNVVDMSYMFNSCDALTTIPQLDTSKVARMEHMFNSCDALTTIPQLDTSNVTNMNSMFYYCSKLTTIPQLDTSNVTNMSYMFYNCSKLTELRDFNCVKVTNFGNSSYSSWLYGCSNIQKIGVVDCDSVTSISYFFGSGTQSKLTDFGGCRNLGKASSVSSTNSDYFMTKVPNLTYESVMNVINGLYDRASAGLSVLTLKLHANHLAMLSDDDIAIATNKGWTIV
jgi:surface protein